MGFLVPAFLGALVALALPLWLHLRRRNRRTPVRFPSLRFLRALPIQVTRRRRLADLPLLLLRALAVAALVLAFARPVVRPRGGAAGTGARDVVLLVDRSLSMGAPGAWARALDSARAEVARLRDGDRVAVVAFDDAAEVVAPLAPDPGAALAALRALAPRPRGTAVAGAARAGLSLLEPRPGVARALVLVSDLQATGVRALEEVALPAGVAWRAVAVGPASYRNRFAAALRARRLRPDGRSLLAVQARVRTSASPEPATPARERVVATLRVNGRAAATDTVTVEGAADAAVAFAPVPVPEDAALVEVALAPDALPADDTVRTVVPREQPLPVMLLADGDDGEVAYLRQALALVYGPRAQVERRTALGAPPPRAEGAPPPVVLAWDRLPPADAVTAWRAQGAGMVLLAGPRVATRRGVAAPWPVSVQGMADRGAERGGRLGRWRAEHPLFAPFREVPQALGEPRAWRYPRLDATGDGEVLARFDDGLPAVVRALTPGAPQMVVALPLGTAQGEWPLHPAFVPLVQQLVHEAAGGAIAAEALASGARWRVPAAVRDPVVLEPGGALQRPDGDAAAGSAVVTLADAGVYQLYAERAAGVPVRQLAVNVPEGESQLDALPARAVRPGAAAAGDTSGTAASAAATPERVERRQNGWRWLLLLAAAALLAETVLATRGRRAMVQEMVTQREGTP